MIIKYLGFLFFSIALTILLSLSYWQVQRLEWKNNIIDQLNIEYGKDPAKNNLTFKKISALETETYPLFYGQVRGNFEYKKQILLGPKSYKNKIGYHVITPLKLNKGGYILVNRGWIEQENIKNLIDNRAIVTVTGILRKPDWNRFTPNNSPENNIWTKLDIQEIANEKNINQIAPLVLYAESKTSDIIFLQEQKWYPRNKHLQYAIFWFMMGVVLIAVFGIYRFKKKTS